MHITRAGWKLGMIGLLTAAGATFARASAYSAAVLADNPKVYWQLNETSGASTAADSAPTAGANGAQYRTGTGAGSAGGITLGVGGAPINDPANTAASLSGSRSGGAATATTSFLSASAATMDTSTPLGNDYTVEFWFNNQRPEEAVNNGSNTISGYLFERGSTAPNSDLIGIDGPFTSGGLVTDRLFILNGSTIYSSSLNPTEGAWYFVALTRSASNVKLYINGALDLDVTLSPAFTTSDITMGKRVDDFWPYQGLIDEVAIYGGALSAEQIQTHFDASLAPEPSSIAGMMVMACTILWRTKRR